VIGHGSMSWFDQGCDIDWEGGYLHCLWLVLLESVKDLFLGVDP
jgi:hypothetical protein